MSVTKEGYEPPETATPEPDEELTDPEEVDTPLEVVADEEVLDEDALEAFELLAAVELEAVPLDVEAETPGIVIALTAPRMPTPATAAKAMPAVMLLSSDRARSLALILASAEFVGSMVIRLRPTSQSSL